MNLLRSLSVRVLAGLALGLSIGAWAAAYAPGLTPAIEGVEAFGALWLNALRMTVVPLIFAVLVAGIAQVADAAATGRLAARSIALFVVLLLVSCGVSLAVCEAAYALWPVSAEAAQALRGAATGTPPPEATSPDFAVWLKGLAPANPLKAATEDQILPLVVFAAFTGFALTRLPPERGRPVIDVIQALGEAMIVIVRWVLLVGPLGVFALGLGVGLRAGAGAAGVIGQYVVVASLAGLAIAAVAYALAVTAGRVPLGQWFRATSPVLATAFATQSSIACLPAMIERSRDNLGVPQRIAGVVLPLAVAIFRFTSPAVNLAVCIFLTKVYGIEPTPLQWTAGFLVAIAVSIGSVGLPGQISFIVSVAPIALALGLPIELLPILLAVEVIPDIFRTVGNVSGDMAVTAVLSRGERELPAEPQPA